MNNQMTPKALNELGDKYFYGQNTSANIELAYTYYKQAADQGNPVGLYNVGRKITRVPSTFTKKRSQAAMRKPI
jgi:TPR repeat protein